MQGVASIRRGRFALACLAVAASAAVSGPAAAEEPLPPARANHNLFGMTGLIDMPSAEMQPDGEVVFTSSFFGGYLRNTFSAQILPGIEGAFRYSILNEVFSEPGGALYDRSFDVKLKLIEEGRKWPGVVFGLQDFLGTGIYSGEYFAATKTLMDGDLKLTGGFGWGRFAGASGLSNPLCFNGNSLCTRDGPAATGGTVNFGGFFSGEDLGVFGGVEWRTPIDGLTFKAEYSDDLYWREEASGDFERKLPLNFGLEYRPWGGVEVGTYYMYGSEFGLRVTLSGNPFRPMATADNQPPGQPIRPRPVPERSALAGEMGEIRDLVTARTVTTRLGDAGLSELSVEARPDGQRWATAVLPPSADYLCPDEQAKAVDAELGMIDAVSFRHADGTSICTVALRPAAQEAIRQALHEAADYPTDWHADAAQRRAAVEQLTAALGADEIGLIGIDLRPTEVSVYIENRRFRAMPLAIGRTTRALANTLPPSVELFEIVPVEGGVPVASILLRRAAVEDLVGRPDAVRGSWLAAEVRDAELPDWGEIDGTLGQFPRPYWSVSPHLPISFFDPDSPLRFDLSLLAHAGVEFLPGLSVNATGMKRLAGNLSDIQFDSDSVLPHVRSDVRYYLQEGDPGLQRLTLDYVTKLDDDIYGRLSAGYLEWMYGGVSAELLWQPTGRNWGLGGEINWVKQRDFDQRFGFRDYDIVTGHASLYLDTGWHGMSAQLDAGRYLAGDWGSTLTLKRRFANGWELGAFATFTDVSFTDFGEGSFDKGIILTIPFDWALPFQTRDELSTVIRPLTRDGGQRVSIANRLYPTVEDLGRDELRGRWQEFWK